MLTLYEEREILEDIADRFKNLKYIDLLIIFSLKQNIPKENIQ